MMSILIHPWQGSNPFPLLYPKKVAERKTPGAKTPKTPKNWKPKVMEVDGSDDFCFERLGDFKVKPAVNFQGCIGAFKDFLQRFFGFFTGKQWGNDPIWLKHHRADRVFFSQRLWPPENPWSLSRIGRSWSGSTISTLLHEKITLKVDRKCPLVMQGFSNFLGLFQVIMANPVDGSWGVSISLRYIYLHLPNK